MSSIALNQTMRSKFTVTPTIRFGNQGFSSSTDGGECPSCFYYGVLCYGQNEDTTEMITKNIETMIKPQSVTATRHYHNSGHAWVNRSYDKQAWSKIVSTYTNWIESRLPTIKFEVLNAIAPDGEWRYGSSIEMESDSTYSAVLGAAKSVFALTQMIAKLSIDPISQRLFSETHTQKESWDRIQETLEKVLKEADDTLEDSSVGL